MSKVKTVFFCQNCGAQSAKWIGRCPSCNEWNTYVEEVVQKPSTSPGLDKLTAKRTSKPQKIDEITLNEDPRKDTNSNELNRVLGGGLVPGSLILIAGEPGIGKSTLMLQVALRMQNFKVLYVSGEESEQQIRMRAERIGISNKNCFILTETSTQNIFLHIETIEPQMVVIDSIQT